MSDLSIQSVNLGQAYNSPQNRQQKPAENSVPYYESNVGLKTGAILSIPAVIDFLPDMRLKNADYFEQNVENYRKEAEAGKKNIDKIIHENKLPEGCNKFLKRVQASIPDAEAYRNICARRCRIAIPATIIATGCTIGSGLIIDSIRNNNAKEVAEQYANMSANPNFSAKNTMVAQSGVPYYKSKVGKQFGALFGGALGVLSALLNGGMARTAPNIGFRSFLFALGGLTIGALYDNIVNKRSEKVANNT